MVEEAKKRLFDIPVRSAGFLIGIVLLPVFFAFAKMGHAKKGFIFCCITTVFMLIMFMKPIYVRNKIPFIILFAIYLLQVTTIIFLKLSEQYFPGFYMMPVAILDYIVVSMLMRFVLKKHP